jgi:hypothetical protein
MAVNDKTNAVIQGYTRNPAPVLETDVIRYLHEELQRLERSIKTLAIGCPEVLDQPPSNPVRGMVKYSLSPWDPLGTGYQGLVVYNGTTWIQV